MCRFKGKGFLKSWAAALMIGGSFGLASQECAVASEVVPLMTAESFKSDSEVEIVQTGLLDLLDSDKLLGLFVSTSDSFSDFISPMTNPVFFEDPRTLTEARAIFLHHEIPAALGGQNVDLIALQLRAALTERLSIIATKDGFIFSDSPLLSDGWADVAAGLKYQLIANDEIGAILSSGFTFEMPIGTTQALQGNGNGEFNFFVTGGKRILDTHHVVSTAGWRQPTDRAEESSVFYWSNHIDHQFFDRLYVFTEYNWYHWMSSGQGGVPGVEGGGPLQSRINRSRWQQHRDRCLRPEIQTRSKLRVGPLLRMAALETPGSAGEPDHCRRDSAILEQIALFNREKVDGFP